MLSREGHAGKGLFQGVTSYRQDSGLPVRSEKGSDRDTPNPTPATRAGHSPCSALANTAPEGSGLLLLGR